MTICAAIASSLGGEDAQPGPTPPPSGTYYFKRREDVHSLVGQKILAYRLVRASRLYSMWMRLRTSFFRTSHLGLLDLPDGSTLGSTTWLVGGTTMLPPKRCCGTVGKELWSEAMGGNSSRGLPTGDRTETLNRVADLSPGLMENLGITTDDEVEVIYPCEE